MAFKDVLRNIAPALGAAFGGPVGNVVGIVSQVLLGKPDGKPAELESALAKATPADLLALKQADQAFAEKMAEIGIDLEKIDAGDRESARARQVAMKDHTPTVIAGGVMVSFLVAIWFVCTQTISHDAQPVVMTMLGTLGTLATTIVTYYFGSSRSSAKKDETIAAVAAQS